MKEEERRERGKDRQMQEEGRKVIRRREGANEKETEGGRKGRRKTHKNRLMNLTGV